MTIATLAGIATIEEETQDGFFDFTGAGEAISLALAPELVPEHGRYEHAWYRVGIKISAEPHGQRTTVDATTAVHEFSGELVGNGKALRLTSQADGSIGGSFDLEPFYLSWTAEEGVGWLPSPCFVTVELTYDLGQTCSFLQSPETRLPTGEEVGYVTPLPAFDCEVDYRGRLVSAEGELELPSSIAFLLPVGEYVLVVLDTEMEGELSGKFSSTKNMFAFESGGDIVWTAEAVTDDTDRQYSYQQVWIYNEHLFATLFAINESGRLLVELDPVTGTIIRRNL